MQPVSSMVACYISAYSVSGTPVHFGAHPALTRVVHVLAKRRRWRPQRRKLKQLISRRRRAEGTRLLDERVAKDRLSYDFGRYTFDRVERYSTSTCVLSDKRSDAVSAEE